MDKQVIEQLIKQKIDNNKLCVDECEVARIQLMDKIAKDRETAKSSVEDVAKLSALMNRITFYRACAAALADVLEDIKKL